MNVDKIIAAKIIVAAKAKEEPTNNEQEIARYIRFVSDMLEDGKAYWKESFDMGIGLNKEAIAFAFFGFSLGIPVDSDFPKAMMLLEQRFQYYEALGVSFSDDEREKIIDEISRGFREAQFVLLLYEQAKAQFDDAVG
jgi:hypothetical protein